MKISDILNLPVHEKHNFSNGIGFIYEYLYFDNYGDARLNLEDLEKINPSHVRSYSVVIYSKPNAPNILGAFKVHDFTLFVFFDTFKTTQRYVLEAKAFHCFLRYLQGLLPERIMAETSHDLDIKEVY
jgi:hypothetical protein